MPGQHLEDPLLLRRSQTRDVGQPPLQRRELLAQVLTECSRVRLTHPNALPRPPTADVA